MCSEALSKVDHDITHVVVSGGAGSIDGQIDPHESSRVSALQRECASTSADDAAFWLLVGVHGASQGHGPHARKPVLDGRAFMARGFRIKRSQTSVFQPLNYFAYGLGNALSFPMSVGATTVLMAGRPTPTAVFDKWKAQRPTIFFGAPTGYAAMLADPQKAEP